MELAWRYCNRQWKWKWEQPHHPPHATFLSLNYNLWSYVYQRFRILSRGVAAEPCFSPEAQNIQLWRTGFSPLDSQPHITTIAFNSGLSQSYITSSRDSQYHLFKQLTIENCPILWRRCLRPTGEDWPIISHVPCVIAEYENQQEETNSPGKHLSIYLSIF